jgi:hypothetical protein
LEARTLVGVKLAVAPAQATIPATAPPGPVRVKVDVVTVAQFIAWLKVAEIVVLGATPVALLRGLVEVTVGGGSVVKLHTKLLASAAPAPLVTPVVIVAV